MHSLSLSCTPHNDQIQMKFKEKKQQICAKYYFMLLQTGTKDKQSLCTMELLNQMKITICFVHFFDRSDDEFSIFKIFNRNYHRRLCFCFVLNHTIKMQSISCCYSRSLCGDTWDVCDAFVWRNITSHFVFNSHIFLRLIQSNAICFFHYYLINIIFMP